MLISCLLHSQLIPSPTHKHAHMHMYTHTVQEIFSWNKKSLFMSFPWIRNVHGWILHLNSLANKLPVYTYMFRSHKTVLPKCTMLFHAKDIFLSVPPSVWNAPLPSLCQKSCLSLKFESKITSSIKSSLVPKTKFVLFSASIVS